MHIFLVWVYFDRSSAMTSAKCLVLGARTMWASPGALAMLFHGGASAQSAKGLGEVKYRLQGVMVNKYTFSQSHHLSHCSETAVPVTVMHGNNSPANGKTLFKEIILASDGAHDS